MKGFTKTIAYIGICTALLIVASLIYVPTTPPITLQLLFVFIICGLFNFKVSFFAILTYILLGILGLPIFSGFRGGIVVLLSPTGGFILSFILFPFAKLCFFKIKNYILKLSLTFLLGLFLLYIVGFLHLGYFLNSYSFALKTSLIFLPLDILKGIIAITICNAIYKTNLLK